MKWFLLKTVLRGALWVTDIGHGSFHCYSSYWHSPAPKTYLQASGFQYLNHQWWICPYNAASQSTSGISVEPVKSLIRWWLQVSFQGNSMLQATTRTLCRGVQVFHLQDSKKRFKANSISPRESHSKNFTLDDSASLNVFIDSLYLFSKNLCSMQKFRSLRTDLCWAESK